MEAGSPVLGGNIAFSAHSSECYGALSSLPAEMLWSASHTYGVRGDCRYENKEKLRRQLSTTDTSPPTCLCHPSKVSHPSHLIYPWDVFNPSTRFLALSCILSSSICTRVVVLSEEGRRTAQDRPNIDSIKLFCPTISHSHNYAYSPYVLTAAMLIIWKCCRHTATN